MDKIKYQEKLLKECLFKKTKIKYFKIRDNAVWIKYKGQQEEYLTDGKIDFDDFWNTQGLFVLKAQVRMLRKAKTWKKRHNRYLKWKLEK